MASPGRSWEVFGWFLDGSWEVLGESGKSWEVMLVYEKSWENMGVPERSLEDLGSLGRTCEYRTRAINNRSLVITALVL